MTDEHSCRFRPNEWEPHPPSQATRRERPEKSRRQSGLIWTPGRVSCCFFGLKEGREGRRGQRPTVDSMHTRAPHGRAHPDVVERRDLYPADRRGPTDRRDRDHDYARQPDRDAGSSNGSLKRNHRGRDIKRISQVHGVRERGGLDPRPDLRLDCGQERGPGHRVPDRGAGEGGTGNGRGSLGRRSGRDLAERGVCRKLIRGAPGEEREGERERGQRPTPRLDQRSDFRPEYRPERRDVRDGRERRVGHREDHREERECHSRQASQREGGGERRDSRDAREMTDGREMRDPRGRRDDRSDWGAGGAGEQPSHSYQHQQPPRTDFPDSTQVLLKGLDYNTAEPEVPLSSARHHFAALYRLSHKLYMPRCQCSLGSLCTFSCPLQPHADPSPTE